MWHGQCVLWLSRANLIFMRSRAILCPDLSWTKTPEGVMDPFCLSRDQDKWPQVRNKRQNLAQMENTPQGRRLTTWRGRNVLQGNAARAVPLHTMVGWVSSSALSGGHRQGSMLRVNGKTDNAGNDLSPYDNSWSLSLPKTNSGTIPLFVHL